MLIIIQMVYYINQKENYLVTGKGVKPSTVLADKIMKGAPAKRIELPDFTEDMTDFDVDDIVDGVDLEGMDMPSPDDYLSALQKLPIVG